MKKLALLALVLAACKAEPSPRHNRAAEFITDVDADAKCTDWGTGSGGADAALCRSQGYLFFCTAGASEKPKCDGVANLHPQAAAQAPAPQPAPQPPAPAPQGSGLGSGSAK